MNTIRHRVCLPLARRFVQALADYSHVFLLAACLALLWFIPQARGQSGPVILFQATDLADTTAGQNLWQYSYLVSGFNFQANQGFSIFFDHQSYLGLQSPPPAVGPDWNILSVQPDLVLGQPGYYDALALQNNPSLANPFVIDFIWQGGDTPGAQPFTIYNSDFSTLFAGQTVPEPTVSVLTGLGMVVLLLRRRFHKR